MSQSSQKDTVAVAPEQRPKRGPGAPNFNGGKLAPPWPKGVSGNPNGRPSDKPITDAYNRILRMTPLELAHFKTTPQPYAERVAWAMIQRACKLSDRLMVAAAKEITDRVEGTSINTTKVTDGGQPVRVRLEFTPRGPRTVVEQLTEGNPPDDGEGGPEDPDEEDE